MQCKQLNGAFQETSIYQKIPLQFLFIYKVYFIWIDSEFGKVYVTNFLRMIEHWKDK